MMKKINSNKKIINLLRGAIMKNYTLTILLISGLFAMEGTNPETGWSWNQSQAQMFYYLELQIDGSAAEGVDYGTSYYGYLWSEVYAQDMYSVFQSKGILNPEIGARFRKIIFEPGSSIEPMLLIKDFLGREPENDSFFKRMGI